MGNFHGFNTYAIEDAKKPKLLASIVCPGGQGDVSVHGNLLFMSVEQTRGRVDCGTQGVPETASAERFRGVRIFDISDLRKPKQVAAVQTCRGSHTHTLVTDPNDKANIYVYGSGTGAVRSGEELAECSGGEPKDNPNTALFSIDVIKVPLAAPEKAAIVNRPRIFADPTTGNIAGLWMGGDHGPGTQRTSTTNQCHDITVFPEVGLAAGACSGNGILMDISDPVHPTRLDHVSDTNFAYWHSATFNNDGTKIIFTDEWGGGTRPRCRATDLLTWGADAIFDIVDKKLKFGGYYKMPAAQTEQENCVAHNGSLIPVPGRDIMVQAWYQGGLSVFDFTDSAHPVEIAYFDRGPIDAKQLDHRRLLVHLLVQRQHLRRRDRPRHRRVPAAAERVPVAERDRRGDAGQGQRVQRAAAAARQVAGDDRRRQGVSRSAEPQQDDRRRPCEGGDGRARQGRPAALGQGERRRRDPRPDRFARRAAREGCQRRHRPRRDAPEGARRDAEGTGGAAAVGSSSSQFSVPSSKGLRATSSNLPLN